MIKKTGYLWALALLLAVVSFVGCATSDTSGVRTLKQTDMDVSWPMTRYRNVIASGSVTLNEQRQVDQAYASYRAAYQQALQAVGGNGNAPTPDNVKALADNVIAAIAAIPF